MTPVSALLLTLMIQMSCVNAAADVRETIETRTLAHFRERRGEGERRLLVQRICRNQLLQNSAPAACPAATLERACAGEIGHWSLESLKLVLRRRDLGAPCRKKVNERLQVKIYQSEDTDESGPLGLGLEMTGGDEANSRFLPDDL